MKNNESLKLYAKGSGVPYWRIAKKMGVSENTLVRLMREELPEEKEKEIRLIIDEIKKEA